MSSKRDTLEQLLRRPDIWRAGDADAAPSSAIPSGLQVLDATLYQRGWPAAALTELLVRTPGIGDIELLLPALRHCSRRPGWLLWLAPPALPYAPALQQAGIAVERLLIVRPRHLADTLWSAEQALRSGSCCGLLAWLDGRQPQYAQLRRLQLAAADNGCPCFLFRPLEAAELRSPASLRLSLRGAGRLLSLRVLKQRGGRSGQVLQVQRDQRLPVTAIPAIALPTFHALAHVPQRNRSRAETALPTSLQAAAH